MGGGFTPLRFAALSPGSPVGQPAGYVVVGSGLRVYDGHDQSPWEQHFDHRLDTRMHRGHAGPAPVTSAADDHAPDVRRESPLARLADIDGDGRVEHIFVAHFAEAEASPALHCFDASRRRR